MIALAIILMLNTDLLLHSAREVLFASGLIAVW